MNIKLFNKYKNVGLNVSDKLIFDLEGLGIIHYPNEFGGFLFGNYSRDFWDLNVLAHIVPKTYINSPCLFERNIDNIKHLFKTMYEEYNYYYIGEWHTHPLSSSMYSQTDLSAMHNIANHPSVTIYNPVLLILDMNRLRMRDFSFYLYDNKRLHKYE
jgi:proteasome lid subunit RPN8/RPN11